MIYISRFFFLIILQQNIEQIITCVILGLSSITCAITFYIYYTKLALEGGWGDCTHFLKAFPQMKCPRGDFYYKMYYMFFRIQRSLPNVFKYPTRPPPRPKIHASSVIIPLCLSLKQGCVSFHSWKITNTLKKVNICFKKTLILHNLRHFSLKQKHVNL